MQSILEGIWPFFGIITLVCGYFVFKATSKRWFAWFMDSWVVRYEAAVKPIKTEHFATLKDVVSKDPLLNSKGLFRLVEIGAGTGANLQYYSSNAEITVVDVNRHMEKYFIKNQEKHKDLHFGQYVVATAEDMKGIESGSVDVVVETKLMCSVVDAEAVFKEVARVLAPPSNLTTVSVQQVDEFHLEKLPCISAFFLRFSSLSVFPFMRVCKSMRVLQTLNVPAVCA